MDMLLVDLVAYLASDTLKCVVDFLPCRLLMLMLSFVDFLF